MTGSLPDGTRFWAIEVVISEGAHFYLAVVIDQCVSTSRAYWTVASSAILPLGFGRNR